MLRILIVLLAESDYLQRVLDYLGWIHYLECRIHTKDLVVAYRDQYQGVWPYINSIQNLDGPRFWRKNLAHGRQSFSWFPYVMTHDPGYYSTF